METSSLRMGHTEELGMAAEGPLTSSEAELVPELPIQPLFRLCQKLRCLIVDYPEEQFSTHDLSQLFSLLFDLQDLRSSQNFLQRLIEFSLDFLFHPFAFFRLRVS